MNIYLELIVKYNFKIHYIIDTYIYTLITVNFVSARKKTVICMTCSVHFLEVKTVVLSNFYQ